MSDERSTPAEADPEPADAGGEESSSAGPVLPVALLSYFLGALTVVVVGAILFVASPRSAESAKTGDTNTNQDPTPSTPEGRALFTKLCAVCHGSGGQGDGPAAKHLDPRPRDFSQGLFKFGTTRAGDLPSDADLGRAISERIYWSAMHPGPDLKPAEVSALVARVKELSGGHFQKRPERKPYEFPPRPVVSPGLIEVGRKEYAKSCSACHGANGKGQGPVAAQLMDAWGHKLAPRDLTAPIYKGGATVTDIVRTINRGMPGTPMPGFSLKPEKLWAIATYVHSLQRWPKRLEEKGQLLYRALGCSSCHGARAEGGVPDPNYIKKGTPALNTLAERLFLYDKKSVDIFTGLLQAGKDIGSLPESPGIDQWPAVQARYKMVRKVIKDGSEAGQKDPKSGVVPFSMPSWGHKLSPADLDALIAYLITLQPPEEDDDDDDDDDDD